MVGHCEVRSIQVEFTQDDEWATDDEGWKCPASCDKPTAKVKEMRKYKRKW